VVKRQFSIVLKQANDLIVLAASDVTLTRKSERVSGWTISQQLEHLALVNGYLNQRIETALKEPPENADQRPDWRAYMLLWTGYIPRGKAQAPDAVVPQGLSPDMLRQKLAEARDGFAAFEPRLQNFPTSRGRSPHPILGMLTARQWLRFIEVHNNHHLKIIRAIQG
jgi:hypothetical protein